MPSGCKHQALHNYTSLAKHERCSAVLGRSLVIAMPLTEAALPPFASTDQLLLSLFRCLTSEHKCCEQNEQTTADALPKVAQLGGLMLTLPSAFFTLLAMPAGSSPSSF